MMEYKVCPSCTAEAEPEVVECPECFYQFTLDDNIEEEGMDKEEFVPVDKMFQRNEDSFSFFFGSKGR